MSDPGPSSPILLATAEELRLHLEMLEAELTDERAEQILAGVSGLVLDFVDRPTGFEVQTETIELDGHGGRTELLPRFPVVDVEKIVEDPRGAATELEPDVHFEWSADGVIRRLDGNLFTRRLRYYEATVEHGFDGTPEGVKTVVLRVAARAVTNPEGLGTESTLGYSTGFAFDETRLFTLSGPDRRDLERYRA